MVNVVTSIFALPARTSQNVCEYNCSDATKAVEIHAGSKMAFKVQDSQTFDREEKEKW